MNNYIVLNHANLNVPVYVRDIFAFHWAPTAKAHYIYTQAGIIPVSDSMEDIQAKINSLKEAQNLGEK